MRTDPKRLVRLLRAHDNLARIMDARLRIEEMAARELAARHRAMEAAARLILVPFLPGALRVLVEVEEGLKSAQQSTAILRQQRRAVEGRRVALAGQLDSVEAQRARKSEEDDMLETSLVMSKASSKAAMVK